MVLWKNRASSLGLNQVVKLLLEDGRHTREAREAAFAAAKKREHTEVMKLLSSFTYGE